jgi:hypothetical protein
MNEVSEAPDSGVVDDDLGWDDRMDVLRAGLEVVAEVTIESIDTGNDRTELETEAQLIGTAFAGLVRWILDLPDDSTLRRDVIVQVNELIFIGDLTIEFDRGSLYVATPPFDIGTDRAQVPQ